MKKSIKTEILNKENNFQTSSYNGLGENDSHVVAETLENSLSSDGCNPYAERFGLSPDSSFSSSEFADECGEQIMDDSALNENGESEELEDHEPIKECSRFSDDLKLDVFTKVSPELLSFFQNRFLKLDEFSQSDTRQWIERAVDFLDEIQLMNSSYSENDLSAVEFIKRKLQAMFAKSGVIIIDKDSWDPDVQRVVSVKEDSSVTAEVIDENVAFGFFMNGKLIRKQEVSLIIPKKTTGAEQC